MTIISGLWLVYVAWCVIIVLRDRLCIRMQTFGFCIALPDVFNLPYGDYHLPVFDCPIFTDLCSNET